MKKTSTRISLVELMLNSKVHRHTLVKELNDVHVHSDITPEKVVNMVNVMRNASLIAFVEDEITPTSYKKPKALHITLKCFGCVVAKVLIDGGSTLNVLPLSTVQKLDVDLSKIEDRHGFDSI